MAAKFRKKIRSITVIGRRWWHRGPGNTYCSANVLVNGIHVGRVEPTIGYGEYYMQAAGELLERLKYIQPEHYSNGGTQQLWSYCRDHNIPFYYEVSDVSREKDLR